MNKKLGLFRPKSARYTKLFMSFFKTHTQFRESNFELISVQQNVGNSDDIIIHLIRFGHKIYAGASHGDTDPHHGSQRTRSSRLATHKNLSAFASGARHICALIARLAIGPPCCAISNNALLSAAYAQGATVPPDAQKTG